MSERDIRRQGFRKKSSSKSPARVRQGADARADRDLLLCADPKWQIASGDKRSGALQDCAPGHGAGKIDVEKRRDDPVKLMARRSSSSAAEKIPVHEIPASTLRDRPHSPFKPSPRRLNRKGENADTPRQGISTARRSSSPIGLPRSQRHDRRSSSPSVISIGQTQPRQNEATQSAEPSRQHFLRILFDKCVLTYPVSLGRGGHERLLSQTADIVVTRRLTGRLLKPLAGKGSRVLRHRVSRAGCRKIVSSDRDFSANRVWLHEHYEACRHARGIAMGRGA